LCFPREPPFIERIKDQSKNWKFAKNDVLEREFWDDYQKAYEKAINETATKRCPWYIIPADKKWFARHKGTVRDH